MFATMTSDPYPILDEFTATHFLLDSSKITSCRIAYDFYVSWANTARHPSVRYSEFVNRVAKSLSTEIVKARPSNRHREAPVRCFRGVVLTVN